MVRLGVDDCGCDARREGGREDVPWVCWLLCKGYTLGHDSLGNALAVSIHTGAPCVFMRIADYLPKL